MLLCFHMRIPKQCLSVYPKCPYPEKKNHPGFINISPTLVIDTSMERSSLLQQHVAKPQNLNFFSKKFQIEF